jgi:CRP-like cAMP-binding protein
VFSLLAIGGNNRRTANIRSKGYSTLFVLSKEDLNDVIRDYPDAQQLLKRKARKMLKKDETKTEVDPKQARLNLKEKCRISTDIKTPKMLEAVAKLLPSSSPVKKELDKVLERESFYCIS